MIVQPNFGDYEEFKKLVEDHVKMFKEIEDDGTLEKIGFIYLEADVFGKSGWFLHVNDDFYIYFNNHLQCSIFKDRSYMDLEIERYNQLFKLFELANIQNLFKGVF